MIGKVMDMLGDFFSDKRMEERISWFIIISVVAVITFFILYRADWMLGDNLHFVLYTGKGNVYPLFTPFKVGETRFFPFAWIDLNLLLLVPGGTSAFAHYMYAAFSFVVFCLFFLLSCKKICKDYRIRYGLYFAVVAFVLAVFNTGFFDCFLNLMYPDRYVVILFAAFAFLMLRYRECGKTYLLVLAFACAFFSTYCKETVFAFFVVYAVWTLFFQKECSRQEKIFMYSLIVNGVVFLLMYYLLAWRGHSVVYAKDAPMGILQLCSTVFRNSALLLFVFIFSIVRFFKCLVSKGKSLPVIDPLIAASAVYALEYFVLGYSSTYYYAPAVTAGAIPVVLYASRIVSEHRYAGTAILMLLLLVPVAHFASVSSCINNTVMERIKVMPGLRHMASLQRQGGKIYWFNPANDLDVTYSLVNTYINFINKTDDVDYLVKIYDMPELDRNDVFLYTLNSSTLKIPVYPAILQSLGQNKFVLFQYQTGFLVFMHEDNLKL